MEKKLGCLHAHYSNIDYIETALSGFEIELFHFVDPGLITRVTSDQSFHESDAQRKVKEQIEWIAQCNVDAILITCTNYIAFLQDDQLSVSVPIIKIDEPYFEAICKIDGPQTIFFSNPATVDGTMARLKQYAGYHQKSLDNVDVVIIHNTFELFLKGFKEKYNQEIAKYIVEYLNNGQKVISVAQLSMVDAALQVECKTKKKVINPLETLKAALVKQLKLEK